MSLAGWRHKVGPRRVRMDPSEPRLRCSCHSQALAGRGCGTLFRISILRWMDGVAQEDLQNGPRASVGNPKRFTVKTTPVPFEAEVPET